MTYSIAATNSATREVGGAGTSCLTGDDVYVIYGGVPGRGVVHAQAYYNAAGRRRGTEMLTDGQAPADIISAITQASFDRNAAIRQYGVVDVAGNAAGFTGDGTMPFAADRQGQVGPFSYSVQGNTLTSAKVLEQAASAFEGGCDLAEKLMRALEAGAQGGEGDSRCTPQGIPSDSAFLQVERPEGQAGDHLALRVPSSGGENPLLDLRSQLDAWRVGHPCPAPPVTEPGIPMNPEPGVPMNPEPLQPSSSMDEGCACRVAHESDSGAWLLGFLLVVALGRRLTVRQLRPIQPA